MEYKINNPVFTAFNKMTRIASMIRKDMLFKLSLSSNECMAILVISSSQNINQKQLSEMCALDKSTTSRLVKKLCKNKIIEKIHLGTDKRNVYLRLLEDGQVLSNKLSQAIADIIDKSFVSLDGDDKITLFKLLSKN